MAPAGPWELAFLFWRRDLFFARKRDFCVCFLFVFGGVFALLGGVFALRGHYFACSAIFLAFPPRGAVSKRKNFRSARWSYFLGPPITPWSARFPFSL